MSTRTYVSIATPAAGMVYLFCCGVASAHEPWQWVHPAMAAFIGCAWLALLSVTRMLANEDRANELRSGHMRVTPEERAVVEAMRKDGP